ncbi:SAUR-like auxin-responsive protein family [Rhynchospora pubera]|uniref:SAUR-like auxin-responsive protein family n=1 Tax=Rhynchospora pubera TaxID=906938 RepID=A0AAV8CQX3_9POAL|nr:SAUR-like auxin-responsive protein family [Rhynchospora pubera]
MISLLSSHSPFLSHFEIKKKALSFLWSPSSLLFETMKKILRRLSKVGDSSQYQPLHQNTKPTTGYCRWRSARVPSGHVPVYVGDDKEEPMERFVIKAELLSQPAFAELLSQVADEFGYNHSGALRIPCSVSVFEQFISRAAYEAGQQ